MHMHYVSHSRRLIESILHVAERVEPTNTVIASRKVQTELYEIRNSLL